MHGLARLVPSGRRADGVSAGGKKALVEAAPRVGELDERDAGLLVRELDARARDRLARATVSDRPLERAGDGVLRRGKARGRECDE